MEGAQRKEVRAAAEGQIVWGVEIVVRTLTLYLSDRKANEGC